MVFYSSKSQLVKILECVLAPAFVFNQFKAMKSLLLSTTSTLKRTFLPRWLLFYWTNFCGKRFQFIKNGHDVNMAFFNKRNHKITLDCKCKKLCVLLLVECTALGSICSILLYLFLFLYFFVIFQTFQVISVALLQCLQLQCNKYVWSEIRVCLVALLLMGQMQFCIAIRHFHFIYYFIWHSREPTALKCSVIQWSRGLFFCLGAIWFGWSVNSSINVYLLLWFERNDGGSGSSGTSDNQMVLENESEKSHLNDSFIL